MEESFYFSNMSPQVPGFNRGIWKRLEEQVRTWAVDNKAVYVITGPVLKKELPTIGSEHISVPELFYKVVLDYTLPDVKAIAFVLPNQSSTKSLSIYTVTIDSVEALTGIDFFPQLPDDQEKLIESSTDYASWNWKENKSSQNLLPAAQSDINRKAPLSCKKCH